MDLNKAMIIGRLTRDPEVRTTPQGTQVASFGVATNLNWTNAGGEKQDKVEYHNVVAWQKLADICGQYLKKGSKVYIEGRLETRSWDAQDGSKKSRTEIVARDMIMLDSKGSLSSSPAPSSDTHASSSKAGSSSNAPTKDSGKKEDTKSQAQQEQEEEINIEDIPF